MSFFPGDFINQSSDVSSLHETSQPSTGPDEGSVFVSDGSNDQQQGGLYYRHPADGPVGAIGMANSFVFDTGATAYGNVYTSWAKLYADVVRAKTVAGEVGRWAGITIVCAASETVPAGTYDLSDCTIVALGGLTFADGVVFSAVPKAFRCAGFFSNPLVFECTTTSVFTGGPINTVFEGWYSSRGVKTGAAATVPAFVLNDGGVSRVQLKDKTRLLSSGATAIFKVSNNGTLNMYLSGASNVDGNPFDDDGASGETIVWYYTDDSMRTGADSVQPWDKSWGVSLNKAIAFFPSIEQHGSYDSSPFKVLQYSDLLPDNNLWARLKMVSGSELLVRRNHFGEVVPAAGNTLVGGGVLFSGVSHDTLAHSLDPFGWKSTFSVPAGPGTSRGFATTSTVLSRQSRGFWVFRWGFDDITAVRYIHALTGTHVGAARTGLIGTDSPAGDLIGLQFSTNRADTTLQVVTQQNGGAQNLIDTGVSVSGPMHGLFIVDCRDQSFVRIYVCDDLSGWRWFSVTVPDGANLPLVGSALGFGQMYEALDANPKTSYFTLCHYHIGDVI